MWLFVFIIIHAIGNLHVFLCPNDFNGYGYFYVRLYWTGFGLPANIVEIYVALAALRVRLGGTEANMGDKAWIISKFRCEVHASGQTSLDQSLGWSLDLRYMHLVRICCVVCCS